MLGLWADLVLASNQKPHSICRLEIECGYSASLKTWRQIIDDWYTAIHHGRPDQVQ